jgi:hypothetical protein
VPQARVTRLDPNAKTGNGTSTPLVTPPPWMKRQRRQQRREYALDVHPQLDATRREAPAHPTQTLLGWNVPVTLRSIAMQGPKDKTTTIHSRRPSRKAHAQQVTVADNEQLRFRDQKCGRRESDREALETTASRLSHPALTRRWVR